MCTDKTATNYMALEFRSDSSLRHGDYNQTCIQSCIMHLFVGRQDIKVGIDKKTLLTNVLQFASSRTVHIQEIFMWTLIFVMHQNWLSPSFSAIKTLYKTLLILYFLSVCLANLVHAEGSGKDVSLSCFGLYKVFISKVNQSID